MQITFESSDRGMQSGGTDPINAFQPNAGICVVLYCVIIFLWKLVLCA